MGKLKNAFMDIMGDDMGGGNALDKKMVEAMIEQDANDFNIGQTIHCIEGDVAYLNAMRAHLDVHKDSIENIIGQLTKITEKL